MTPGRYVYELLTGADLSDSRCPLAFANAQDKSRYLGFIDTLTTPLRAELHDHGSRILSRLGISEPLTWEPPASCCEGITLPGRDPADIDIGAVTRLVITGGIPPGTAAAQLGTTISHVRLALEQAPRPAREWAPSTPPAAWGKWQHSARSLLTREFFEREYVSSRKTLRQIKAETGIPTTHLAARARELGITVTSAWQPTPIDPSWLRDQYARRSYSDIAAELGVATETVIAAARRHGITGRAKGVRSRPEMFTTLSEAIPPDIRRAVEGSLHGWQRLHRFREAMACPAIGAAARQIGAHPSALIHQFQRLERDIGATLYHRSSPGHPMRPTPAATPSCKPWNTPQSAPSLRRRKTTASRQARSRPDDQRAAPAHAVKDGPCLLG